MDLSNYMDEIFKKNIDILINLWQLNDGSIVFFWDTGIDNTKYPIKGITIAKDGDLTLSLETFQDLFIDKISIAFELREDKNAWNRILVFKKEKIEWKQENE
jgi:hypothetical protein